MTSLLRRMMSSSEKWRGT
uniref:Uncharacterized protein n=1 Tax=Arundo donax TaxID=35708 RepID=A0A0A9BB86_ARUDO